MKRHTLWKNAQPMMKRALLVGLLLLCIGIGQNMTPLEADARGTTVIDGPGFQVEDKKGWFGTSRKTYKDAMGNTVTVKKGLFGRETRETNLFGSKATQNGKNVTVLGPNGKPLVTKKKSWFGGEETRVDGNGIYNNVKELFKENP